MVGSSEGAYGKVGALVVGLVGGVPEGAQVGGAAVEDGDEAACGGPVGDGAAVECAADSGDGEGVAGGAAEGIEGGAVGGEVEGAEGYLEAAFGGVVVPGAGGWMGGSVSGGRWAACQRSWISSRFAL